MCFKCTVKVLDQNVAISYFPIPQWSNGHNFALGLSNFKILTTIINGQMCTLIIYQEPNFDHVHRSVCFDRTDYMSRE